MKRNDVMKKNGATTHYALMNGGKIGDAKSGGRNDDARNDDGGRNEVKNGLQKNHLPARKRNH